MKKEYHAKESGSRGVFGDPCYMVGEIVLGNRVIVGDPCYTKEKKDGDLVSKKCVAGTYEVFDCENEDGRKILLVALQGIQPDDIINRSKRILYNDSVCLGVFDEEKYPLMSGVQRDGTDYGCKVVDKSGNFRERILNGHDSKHPIGFVEEGVYSYVVNEVPLPVVFYYNSHNEVVKIELNTGKIEPLFY